MPNHNLLHSFIDGRNHQASDNPRIPNVNPASNQIISQISVGLENEVDAAVEAATKAQREWRTRTGIERGRILHNASRILRERNAELAAMEVLDTGKPISEASVVDVQSGADAFEFFAGVAPTIKGEYHQLGPNHAYTIREPLGVVAGIGAWNYPLQIACWKASPALAAGNAVLFKPSELTPTTALQLAVVLQQAGLPDGLFNVLLGDYRTGELLVQHPGVAKISLTGSVPTGRNIMRQSASRLKQVTLELGGKSPLIIFDDAKIENAVKATLLANFYTQGEICSNGTRVFVHRRIFEPFLAALTTATSQLRIGDPLDQATQIGALISDEHTEKVMRYIQSGIDAGARLVCGGKRLNPLGAVGQGNFVQPTIFDRCTDQMSIVVDEIFGPVLSLLSFEDEAEVIERANRTEFGLAAGVFTQNLNRATRVVQQLEAGTCWINTYNITPVEIPFGGIKQSGFGRENSEWAITHYTQLKTVYVETGDL